MRLTSYGESSRNGQISNEIRPSPQGKRSIVFQDVAYESRLHAFVDRHGQLPFGRTERRGPELMFLRCGIRKFQNAADKTNLSAERSVSLPSRPYTRAMSRDHIIAVLIDPETIGTLIGMCLVIAGVVFIVVWALGMLT